MYLRIAHTKHFDWDVRHTNDVKPGDVTVPAEHLGPNLHMVRKSVEEPSFTEIDIPDQDIERMFSDHHEAIANTEEGRIPPPSMTRGQLVARHLEQTVMPFHALREHWTDIQVSGNPTFEKFLKGRLLGTAEEEGLDGLAPYEAPQTVAEESEPVGTSAEVDEEAKK